MGSCNTLNDLSNRVCVPNKTKDLNLNIFNTMTRINESKTLTKRISCECKCKFDGRKCNSNNSGIKINLSMSAKLRKNIMRAKNTIFGIILHALSKMAEI